MKKSIIRREFEKIKPNHTKALEAIFVLEAHYVFVKCGQRNNLSQKSLNLCEKSRLFSKFFYAWDEQKQIVPLDYVEGSCEEKKEPQRKLNCDKNNDVVT